MVKFSVLMRVILLLSIAFSSGVNAQDENKKGSSTKAEEVARQLANPNATLGYLSVPIDYILYDGDLPNASSQSAVKLNFQPSLPYPISEGVNFFLRPLFPIIFKQPVFGTQGFEDKGVALGDISFDAAIGKNWQSGWVTIGGIFSSVPTATDESLGSDKWTLGPNAFLGHTFNWGFLGLLAAHSWSLTGNEEGSSSISSGQYFYTIKLKGAWQIKATPTWSYNHNAPSGSRLALPLATGISNTWIVGKTPINLLLQYWYYIARPETFGPQHQIRFQITPVIPLPW